MSTNKTRWSITTKEKALLMRKSGATYNDIFRHLRVPKSTLNSWFLGLQRPDNLYFQNRDVSMKHIRQLSVEMRKKRRCDKEEAESLKVRDEILSLGQMSIGVKKMILSVLYWAEGSKSGSVVGFVNVDSKLMVLFVSLLRQCYKLDESRFRVRLHLHYYHRAKFAVGYWSELLCIPKNKFGKVYWKKRSKERRFRRNKAGICTVRYNSADLQDQLLRFASAVGDRLAPVAQRIERVPAEDEI